MLTQNIGGLFYVASLFLFSDIPYVLGLQNYKLSKPIPNIFMCY